MGRAPVWFELVKDVVLGAAGFWWDMLRLRSHCTETFLTNRH